MAAERAVFITGASTGIGEACALHLDRLGFRVFAGVRKATDGDALLRKASAALEPVRLDITLPNEVAAAAETVQVAVCDRGLAGLVNNAGIVVAAPLELTAKRPRTRYLVGKQAKVAALLARFFPDRMLDSMIMRHLRLPWS